MTIILLFIMANGGGVDRRKELDKDISSYIGSLRKREKRVISDFLKIFKRKNKKHNAELHPEVSVYGKEHGQHPEKKSKEEMEVEEEDMEQHFEEGTTRKSFFGWLKEKFFTSNDVPEPDEDFEVSTEEEKKEPKEEVDEVREELEDEYIGEVQKQGWFSRLMGKIFVKRREEEELEDAADEIAEDVNDMKIIAEIATKVMKMLPSEEMKEFKKSSDFHTFKEVLKKRELIK